MNITLTRCLLSRHGTFGMLTAEDVPLCLSLEDPWRNNKPNVSCIPPGTYECRPWDGRRFKSVWEVCDVPGRSAILIHTGNTIDDTNGCILVGSYFGTLNGKQAVKASQQAMDKLRRILPDEFTLTIVQPARLALT